MTRFEAVVGGASVGSPGSRGNQDRLVPFEARGEQPGAGVIVCDGVGSRPESAAVAEGFARAAAGRLSEEGIMPGLWELDWSLTQAEAPARDGATTLLAVGADESGLVAHLLLGNGSIVEVVPTRLPSGGVRLLWTSIALPQIDWSRGRASLQSVLPARHGETLAARGYRRVMPGRAQLYLACTDGVLTEEERMLGRAEDGTHWQPVPPLFASLLERLRASWDELLGEEVENGIGPGLQRLLERVLEGAGSSEDGLSDDASIGAVLVRPRRASTEGAVLL